MKKIFSTLACIIMLFSYTASECSIKTYVANAKQEALRRALHIKDLIKSTGKRSVEAMSRHKVATGVSVVTAAVAIGLWKTGKLGDGYSRARDLVYSLRVRATGQKKDNPQRESMAKEEGLVPPTHSGNRTSIFYGRSPRKYWQE